MKTRGSFLLKI